MLMGTRGRDARHSSIMRGYYMYIAGGARELGCEVGSATAMGTAGIAMDRFRERDGTRLDGTAMGGLRVVLGLVQRREGRLTLGIYNSVSDAVNTREEDGHVVLRCGGRLRVCRESVMKRYIAGVNGKERE